MSYGARSTTQGSKYLMTYENPRQFEKLATDENTMNGKAEDMEDTIGGRITRARNAQGLSVAQLARRLLRSARRHRQAVVGTDMAGIR